MFGEIHNDGMFLNAAGDMVGKWWNEMANKFPSITPEAFVVMPNHFHGIILIHEIVGADLRVGPDIGDGPRSEGVFIDKSAYIKTGEHIDSPLPNNGKEEIYIKGEHIVGADLRVGPYTNDDLSEKGAHVGAPLQKNGVPLSQIVQWFKTMTTNKYIRGVKHHHWQPFTGKLWQRNYYEHIIRNEEDYERIANYILTNPANWEEDEENR